jgi:hypothetical protein
MIQHYVIKFVSDIELRHVGGVFLALRFPGITVSCTNKTDLLYIIEILLKVALSTITLSFPMLTYLFYYYRCVINKMLYQSSDVTKLFISR